MESPNSADSGGIYPGSIKEGKGLMCHPVCINTGMMALPPRGPSSSQGLWWGGQRRLCVSSRAEAEKVRREIPGLDAWGCSHSQRDALRAAQHTMCCVSPASRKGALGLPGAVRVGGPGAGGSMLTCGCWGQGPLRELGLCSAELSKGSLNRGHGSASQGGQPASPVAFGHMQRDTRRVI